MRALVVMVLAGCGRFSFDAVPDDAATQDAALDAALRFCATHTAQLCSDFDDAVDIAQWTNGSRHNGDYQYVDQHLTVTSVDIVGGDSASGYVQHPLLPASAALIRLSADVRVDLPGTSGPVFFQARFRQGAQLYAVEYVYRLPPLQPPYLEEIYDLDINDATPPMYAAHVVTDAPYPPPGEWNRIGIELDVRSVAPALRVFYDDVLVQTFMGTYAGFGGQPLVEIGLLFIAGATTPWQLTFDNVLADAE